MGRAIYKSNPICDMFPSGKHFAWKDFLKTFETSEQCYVVIDNIVPGIVCYHTLEELKRFAQMAIKDIISNKSSIPKNSYIRREFISLYRTTTDTLKVLETELPILKGDDFRPPVGNSQHWRMKFWEHNEEISRLLAADRTCYALLVSPNTDLTKFSKGANDVDFSSNCLVQVAHAYMDIYLKTHTDRWLKFFRYLQKYQKSDLLSFWYPN